MRRGLSQTARHVITHGERGQTIVILAFGIIVLLAFVGIVTDVSLMFVRFSTLRRAVDAAAVSAAGQVRRLVPTTEEWIKAGGNLANAQSAAGVFNRLDPIEVDWVASGATADVANGLAFARNIANVKLAAESFIEFYGLDPIAVVVDTCATRPADTELCTEDQRKLIRVTAQISSPTVFLKLIGWPDITLESTSLSETAVLDVVLVMDVSESMLNETTYNDWERVPDEINTGSVINLGYRYIPPRMMSGDPNNLNQIVQVSTEIFANDWQGAWQYVLNHTWDEISADPRYAPIQFYPPGRPGTPDAPTRSECQIRFYPGAANLGPKPGNFPADLKAEYEARLGATWPEQWDGFIPTYNFYGCCNDPAIQNPDAFDNYDFTDLICQPFRQARDATEQFMQRIDFLRGDRVAIVTFDRSATLLLPQHTPGDGADTSHMIDNEADALNLLRKAVGVRAESTFYADVNDDGLWDHFVSGGHQITYNSSTDGSPGWDQQILGGITDYPAKDSCPFINATRPWWGNLWSVPSATDYPAIHPNSADQPDYYPSPLAYIMHPSEMDAAGWNAYFNPMPSGSSTDPYRGLYSYELRASCRGTNMGAALRTGYNALTDPDTRRDTGSVWVMVLLSDGAAGASDPATRGGADLQLPNPYLKPDEPGYLNNPTRGDYGVYGVCPFGSPDNPGELVNSDLSFPYCGDKSPETRHFCFDPNLLYTAADGSVNISIELSNARFPNCQLEYDVDDYARDWADFIGLEEPFPWATIDADNTLAQNVAGKRTGTQLPTIFSIGFGLKFPNGGHTCGENVEDCLGEELLRYIADVGDNQQIDTDYQQDLRYDGEGDFDIGAGNSFGARGPCEGPVVGYPDADTAKANGAPLSSIINSLTTRQSCGNYYNAPSGHELEVVFNDIASRMFTQLAR